MDVTNLNAAPPFITKDGSEIRELLSHRNSAMRNQSLAEARLPVGKSTQEHYHAKSEEIYYFTHGTGRLGIRQGENRVLGNVEGRRPKAKDAGKLRVRRSSRVS